jgi:hypothetical protein
VRTFRGIGEDVVHVDACIPYDLVSREMNIAATARCEPNRDYFISEVIVYDHPDVDVAPNCIACVARRPR